VLRVVIASVKADKVDRLRSWMAELAERRDEVFETYARETVSHEIAVLVQGAEGPLLVYAMEVDDPETATEAFQTSKLPIDVEHRTVMDDVLAGAADVELLLDLRTP